MGTTRCTVRIYPRIIGGVNFDIGVLNSLKYRVYIGVHGYCQRSVPTREEVFVLIVKSLERS